MSRQAARVPVTPVIAWILCCVQRCSTSRHDRAPTMMDTASWCASTRCMRSRQAPCDKTMARRRHGIAPGTLAPGTRGHTPHPVPTRTDPSSNAMPHEEGFTDVLLLCNAGRCASGRRTTLCAHTTVYEGCLSTRLSAPTRQPADARVSRRSSWQPSLSGAPRTLAAGGW